MTRLLLKDTSTRKDVSNVANSRLWLWWEELEQTDQQPYEKIWLTDDEKTSIHYIEDFVVNLRYILIKGEATTEVSDILRKHLAILTQSEIETQFANAKTPEEVIIAINMIAVTSPQEYNSDTFKLFEKALNHEDPEVRIATIQALGYPGWLEFVPLLEKVSENDTDDEVKEHASVMIEGYKVIKKI